LFFQQDGGVGSSLITTLFIELPFLTTFCEQDSFGFEVNLLCWLLLWMSLLHVIGFGLKVGHLLLVLCCWIVSLIYINWFVSMDSTKMGFLGDSGKMWLKWWEKILGSTCKIHQQYYQCIGSKRVRRVLWRKLLLAWVLIWCIVSLWIFCFMNLQVTEKRKETLASMCDGRARMLQDQFNVSMNHIQAMSILISTFHHAKTPSAIDQVHNFSSLYCN
jgi:histidine kinase 2/3/4 (cytokinin receptor)